MLERRRHARIEREETLERQSKIRGARTDERRAVGEQLGEGPPPEPVVGEALRERSRAPVSDAHAVGHAGLDVQPLARRQPVPMIAVLRPEGGVDVEAPVVPRQRVAPVREDERRVLGEGTLVRRRRIAPPPLGDGTLPIQERAQRGDRARGHRRQAGRRRTLAPPDASQQRPRHALRERRDVAGRRGHRNGRKRLRPTDRVNHGVDANAVADPQQGRAHDAPSTESTRQAERLCQRRCRLGRMNVREHRERIRGPDAADAVEVGAHRDDELAPEARQRGVRCDGDRWQDGDGRRRRIDGGARSP